MIELQAMFTGFSVNTSRLFPVLLGCIVLDIITGIIKALKNGEGLKSYKMRDGLFKKAGIICVCILGFMISMVFTDDGLTIFNSIIAFCVFTEIVSILENLQEADVPLVSFLQKLIKKSE